MTAQQGGRARTAGPSARPERLRSVHGSSVLPDLILALVVVITALSIMTDPPGGPIDGRHLIAVSAVLILIARTTRAARRY